MDQEKLEDGLQKADEARAKLRSWLSRGLKITIRDRRVIFGYFVCTDRDANTILENSWEYISVEGNDEPRMLGLSLVPGKHIVSIELMT